jgi:hypothetical protein
MPDARPARLPAETGGLVAAVAGGVIAALAACDPPADTDRPAPIGLPVIAATVTVPDASFPSLAVGGDGVVHLSVTARLDSARHALRFLSWRDGAWSTSRDIARDRPFFVNWADVPAIVALENGDLVAHWLEREGPGPYAYGVRLVRSRDGGATWDAPVTPHRDGLRAEHGFVTLWAAGGDRVGAAWLDGRKTAMPDSAREMTLRTATLGRDDAAGDDAAGGERLLDHRACDCCQTASAATRRGRVVVYRDRSAREIRDIAIVREVDGTWTAPVRVHADDWYFTGCPVNGPSVAALGDTVAVAWFTGAQDTARVRVALSVDGGISFGAPVRVDDGDPVGRVSVVLDDRAQPLVLWMERVAPDSAALRVRRIGWSGARSPAVELATVSAARASGFPRVVRHDDQLVFAWTDPGRGVRTATAAVVGSGRPAAGRSSSAGAGRPGREGLELLPATHRGGQLGLDRRQFTLR